MSVDILFLCFFFVCVFVGFFMSYDLCDDHEEIKLCELCWDTQNVQIYSMVK
jgi:hypothetical protein